MILTGEAYRTELKLLRLRVEEWDLFQLRGVVTCSSQDSLDHEVAVFCAIRGLHLRYNGLAIRSDGAFYTISFKDLSRPLVFDDADSTPMSCEDVDVLRTTFGNVWPI